MKDFLAPTAEPPSASHGARAEGRVHEMGAWDKWLYLWNYLAQPVHPVEDSINRHFAAQREWLARLPAGPPPLCRLGFVGDLLWIRRGWESFLPPTTLARLRALDGLVGNLETVVSPKVPVKELWPDLFFFNSHPGLVRSFRRENGENLFAALSFANNHTFDFGDDPAVDTLALLRSLRIPQSGLREMRDEKSWAEFSRGGIRFGFYAATFGVNYRETLATTRLHLNLLPGLAPERPELQPDLAPALAALEEMTAAGVEQKIVSLHWGFEYEKYPTARMLRVARLLATAGADIIVGSHPHVTHPPEILSVNGHEPSAPAASQIAASGPSRKTLVLYSQGNFTTAMFTFRCRLAPLTEVGFWRNSAGRVDWSPPRTEFFYNEPHRWGTRLRPLDELGKTKAAEGWARHRGDCSIR